MKRMHCATAAVLLAVGALATASAQTISYTVDCSKKGQTIADAIQRGDDRKPLVVNLRGTCNEFVSISREDVTLRGDGGATVHGPGSTGDTILVMADRVNIENLTVTGGNLGIRVQGPFSVAIRNSVVRDTAGGGVVVRAGDLAIENCTIEHAGGRGLTLARGASVRMIGSRVHYNADVGIYADTNSTVAVSNASIVADNGSHGIQFENSAAGTINGSRITGNGTDPARGGHGIAVSMSQATISAGNTISDNREAGVVATAGANIGVNNNTITDNGDSGVIGYLGTVLVLHGNTITGNGYAGVACAVDCTVQIGGATIQGNGVHGIDLNVGSKLWLEPPMTDVTGNGGWGLWCGGAESSAADLSLLNGSVSPECTGY